MIQEDFSHLRFIYSRSSTEITIKTIKQFTMTIYRHGNMIEHEQFSEFFESHVLPVIFHVLPRGKMIQLITHF